MQSDPMGQEKNGQENQIILQIDVSRNDFSIREKVPSIDLANELP